MRLFHVAQEALGWTNWVFATREGTSSSGPDRVSVLIANMPTDIFRMFKLVICFVWVSKTKNAMLCRVEGRRIGSLLLGCGGRPL